ncbi:MAG: LCP family protein [Lachnospiraceae bacterium]|nr:LCP family protein [Lachnospiraceae bacterium]
MNNWKKHIPFYVLELLVLLVVIYGSVWVFRATRVEKVNLNASNIDVNDEIKKEAQIAKGEIDTPTKSDTSSSDNEAEASDDIDKEKISKELYDKYNGKFNIAFFGVDSREGQLGKGTRTDSLMVCSINMETHEVRLVSVYRDTYLNVGKDSYNKCNAAYAIGGPERAISMLNTNMDLYVTDYVTVGFEGLIDAIDALDGVVIDVTEEEIFHLNNYQKSMADTLGVEYTPVVYAGPQMLNGLQATAYCRIRYTNGSDFKRAERQRDVITAMLERTKVASVSKLTDAVIAIFPNISTSLNLGDIIDMMSIASDYKVTVSTGFPFDGHLNGANMSCGLSVIPTDLTKNVVKLHKVLYDEEDYKPSDTVKKYSQKIKSMTNGKLLY